MRTERSVLPRGGPCAPAGVRTENAWPAALKPRVLQAIPGQRRFAGPSCSFPSHPHSSRPAPGPESFDVAPLTPRAARRLVETPARMPKHPRFVQNARRTTTHCAHTPRRRSQRPSTRSRARSRAHEQSGRAAERQRPRARHGTENDAGETHNETEINQQVRRPLVFLDQGVMVEVAPRRRVPPRWAPYPSPHPPNPHAPWARCH